METHIKQDYRLVNENAVISGSDEPNVLIKRGKFGHRHTRREGQVKTQTWREDGHVKTESETGVMLTKQGKILPRGFRERVVLQTL